MKYNTDYKKELPENSTVYFVKDKLCPLCQGRMVALPPDRAWCENIDCNHGVLLLVGKGIYEFELYTDEQRTDKTLP